MKTVQGIHNKTEREGQEEEGKKEGRGLGARMEGRFAQGNRRMLERKLSEPTDLALPLLDSTPSKVSTSASSIRVQAIWQFYGMKGPSWTPSSGSK